MPQVLLADDDPLLHRVLGFKLNQARLELLSAYDGAEALRLAKEQRPSLIILDVMMPVMDGFATLRALKQDEVTAAIPVLMLSVKCQDADIVGGLDSGAADYLAKPFSPAELIARVVKLLGVAKLLNEGSKT